MNRSRETSRPAPGLAAKATAWALFISLSTGFVLLGTVDAGAQAVRSAGQSQGPDSSCESLTRMRCSRAPLFQNEGTAPSWSELESRAPDLIRETRQRLIEYLERQNIPDEQRQAMIGRIRSVEVDLNLRSGVRGEASFDHSENRLNVYRANLPQGPSEMALVQTLAHEMSHSIDPCNVQRPVGQGSRAQPAIVQLPPDSLRTEIEATARLPFSDIQRCLVDPRSMGVPDGERRVQRSRERWLPPPGTTVSEAYEAWRPPLCLYTRHLESFADFMAAEVVASSLEQRWQGLNAAQVRRGLANIGNGFCDGDHPTRRQEAMIGNHPSQHDRMQRILLAHPTIARRAGCDRGQGPERRQARVPTAGSPNRQGSETPPYCGARSPDESRQTSSQPGVAGPQQQ